DPLALEVSPRPWRPSVDGRGSGHWEESALARDRGRDQPGGRLARQERAGASGACCHPQRRGLAREDHQAPPDGHGRRYARITLSSARIRSHREGQWNVAPQSLQDRLYWTAFFDRLPDTVLFIVDPLPSYLGRGVNDSKNTEIRQVLEPFIDEILRPRS